MRTIFLVLLTTTACAPSWKVNGPQECVQTCTQWDMELTAMVGVGRDAATACVCQPKSMKKTSDNGSAAVTTMAAVQAAQAAAAAQAAGATAMMHQHQQQQQAIGR